MIHLRSISLKPGANKADAFPFNLPLIKTFTQIEFRSPVTFLAGENGSGKSTLLEAIAAGIGAIAAGAEDLPQDRTLEHARQLGEQLRCVWQQKTRRGFFLRAEDFFNFAKRLKRLTEELEALAASYEQEFTGYALGLAQGAVLGQKAELVKKYGENLDANSHGESFLKLFQARFVPGGLYLLDEPEAPLSPQRQLAAVLAQRNG